MLCEASSIELLHKSFQDNVLMLFCDPIADTACYDDPNIIEQGAIHE